MHTIRRIRSFLRAYLPLSVLLYSCSSQALAQGTISIGQTDTLVSTVFGTTRAFSLALPASYAGDDFYRKKHYPVLIVLDGPRLFPLVAGLVDQMSSPGNEQIPEMITVGVHHADRNAELLPGVAAESGSAQLRTFIEAELLPLIDSTYRTSNCRVLVGHSFGGYFAVETALTSESFRGILAIDPSLWWADAALVSEAAEHLNQSRRDSIALYLSQAENPFSPGIRGNRLGRAVQDFKRVLDQEAKSWLRYGAAYFPGEDHFSIPTISLYRGLQFIFAGYKYPLGELTGQRDQQIREHYQALNQRLGGELLPPGKLLWQVGEFMARDTSGLATGLALLEFVAESYPRAHQPLLSLGQIHQRTGALDSARHYLELARERHPNSEAVRQALAGLER